MLHSKVAMKGLGIGKKRLQHKIVDLITSISIDRVEADEDFTINGDKHTHTNTHIHTHTHTNTHTHTHTHTLPAKTIY